MNKNGLMKTFIFLLFIIIICSCSFYNNIEPLTNINQDILLSKFEQQIQKLNKCDKDMDDILTTLTTSEIS